MLDPRRHPWRADLAASKLEGKVEAAAFCDGEAMVVAAPVLDLFATTKADRLGSQLLFGEQFTVYDTDKSAGLAWGQAADDGYVGYAPLTGLKPGVPGAQRLMVPLGLVFSEPDIKSPVSQTLPFLSRVSVLETRDDFARIDQGWLHHRHLSSIAGDMTAFAEAFIGVPYLWGGRSWHGLDCSALVQLAAMAQGHDCPRDSDMQQAEFGKPLAKDAALRRGDIVFWKGHVGLMVDETTLLHANAHHMATVAEPLATAVARISASGGGQIQAIKRI